jgi:hypothetical protein
MDSQVEIARFSNDYARSAIDLPECRPNEGFSVVWRSFRGLPGVADQPGLAKPGVFHL